MSLLKHVTPAEQIAALGLIARSLRTDLGAGRVPILVVEGANDVRAIEVLCRNGPRQIFAAGSRGLVEQMLIRSDRPGLRPHDCAYLIDCDGRGKTAALGPRRELIVTESCDLEADLIALGVAQRLILPYMASPEAAADAVTRACEMAMPLSIVRRAAHSVSVTMKRGGQQLRYASIAESHLSAWEAEPPSPQQVAEITAAALSWSAADLAKVKAALPTPPAAFAETCLGKDALDALHRIAAREGKGKIREWSARQFHLRVLTALEPCDLERWEVGRRLRAWEASNGHRLLKDG